MSEINSAKTKMTDREMNYMIAYIDWLREVRTEAPRWFSPVDHDLTLRKAEHVLLEAYAADA